MMTLREYYQEDNVYRMMINHIPVGIIIREQGKWVYTNQYVLNILGANKKEDVLGKNFRDFIPDDVIEQLKEKGHNANFIEPNEFTIKRLDGHSIDVELKIFSTAYENKNYEYLIIQDITGIRDGERALFQSEKLTMAGELAAGIAHELRNAVTSLRGFLQLAISENPELNKYSSIMISEIDRIHHLNNELMSIAKPKETLFVKKELKSIIKNVIVLLNTQAILHNIQIFIDYPHELNELIIRCDEDKMRQVLINLIKNSIEAMPDGGEIWLKVKQLKKQVIIQIIDQGKGIPKEFLEKIGQAFFTTKHNGTGLGLKVSYQIVQFHGGEMRIKSKLGKGTTVEIRLPFEKS